MATDITPHLKSGLLGQILEFDGLDDIAREINAGKQAIVLSGVAGSARALFVAAIERRLRRPVVFVTRSNQDIEEFHADLSFFYAALNGADSAESSILALPSPEKDPYDGTSPHPEILEQRALALYRIAAFVGGSRAPQPVIVTSLKALAQRSVPPEVLKSSGLTLRVGEETPIELIVDKLIATGYVRQEPVRSVGEFSLRGGILDVYSPAHENPFRIEFFGDTVDSIREFDSETQRSTGRPSEAIVAPMREISISRTELLGWADAARERWSDERYRRDLRARLAQAERGEIFAGWEYLTRLTQPLSGSGFDYFKNAIYVIDEPAQLDRYGADLYAYFQSRYDQADDAGEMALPPDHLFLTTDELRNRFESAQRMEFRVIGTSAAAVDEQFRVESFTIDLQTTLPTRESRLGEARRTEHAARMFLFPLAKGTPEVHVLCQAPRRYYGRVQNLADDLSTENRESVLFVMPSLGMAERVVEMLGEYQITADLVPALGTEAGEEKHLPACSRVVTVGRVTNGFTLADINLTILVDSDIFGETDRPGRQRVSPVRPHKRRKAAAFLSDLGDLKTGDYIVHVDHGIGQFQGLKQITVSDGSFSGAFNIAEGIERGTQVREFMLLTYSEGARLYVPVERLDLVQRYSAGEGVAPKLDRLGGVGWQKTKARARRAMRDMAEELLKLYAERKLVSGHSYGDDTPWQREFEDAFEYSATSDQEAAIEDVKADMQKPEPMDRLIVGDVGYGKTEVAMRAGFKAIMEGKQVAVLAPTTVLVYQHFKTFQRRFSAFPVRIEMLSRFRSAKEQREVVKSIEAGAVDVVIGTHRLLSKDVHFKELGLLIVDEEQRFGVGHKERIKQLRKKVDVISLSATPIPRTLNMSLAGLRDMSVIETPPRDRLAIQTHVVQFAEAVIRSAIELELQRGGQVFFVHNRVETIYAISELVGRLVPSARIGVGHGQMSEKELEGVMLKFIRHELDVLVSTTIIENGIDIPLANTIIINRADAYGLAQLYQLRGRVGRSNRRAYAYLLIPSEESLTEVARRRLAAIREFSDLGAGFRIAALDLELRGAGNLLGREQSGHIDAIGFDLYTQMLERAVREMKGEPVDDEISTTVNLGVDIRIPEDYIYDTSQRLRAYKRISSALDDAELADIHAEIEDRYGPIPQSVDDLFEYSRLRREASRLKILSIDREGERLTVKFSESSGVDPNRLIELVSRTAARFTPAGVLKMQLESGDEAEVFEQIRELLAALA